MRKLTALLILIVVFLPLAFATMTLTSIRPWILDRSFYENMVSDERLYDALLTEDMSVRFDEQIFTSTEQLPVGALSIALREVVTPTYLRSQSMSIVNQVFDAIDGHGGNFDLRLDITSLKAALSGEERTHFAAALAAALPDCADGQQPVAPGGSLSRCIASGQSVDAVAEQISAALPAVIAATPDQITIDSQGYVRRNWYDFAWFLGSGIHAVLDMALLMMIFVTLGSGLAAAYLGGDNLRARLSWFGASLFAPGFLFLIAGLALTTPAIAGPIEAGIASARWNGLPYTDSTREALLSAILPVVQHIGSGVLLTGFIACAIALGIILWSWATPTAGQQPSRIVQVPVQN